MKKYKEKYKTGMIFRSKKNPWTDFVIDFVSYTRGSETAYTFNMNSIIDWVRINEESFCKHISVSKGIDYDKVKNHEVSTFPYPFSVKCTKNLWIIISENMKWNFVV